MRVTMKDYYSMLKIEKTATAAEIKRAYFTLVRAFPPDRHPEEFMKVRQAYEVLIDENTRREYDSVGDMPDVVRLYFREGQKALEQGDAPRAIKLLEEVIRVYPRFSIVNSLLGEAYLKNENSGKAIRIFEQLAEEEHNNAGFVRRLAEAYAMRGWHKKAVDQFRRALFLDEDNLSLWLGLIDCYLTANDMPKAQETVWEAFAVSKQKGWDNLELYYHIIQLDIFSEDSQNLRQHLEEMKSKALEKEEEKANVAWFLARLAKTSFKMGFEEEAKETIEAAYALQPDEEEIQNTKKEIDSKFRILAQLQKLEEDTSIDGCLATMLQDEMDCCPEENCLDCNITRFIGEMEIIAQLERLRRDVLRLKNAYPELYQMKKAFFDDVLNPKKEDHLLTTYTKLYKKYQKLCPERFESPDGEEDFISQPYRRPEPKVGRNDPCPCGSGKKYKKCCGK